VSSDRSQQEQESYLRVNNQSIPVVTEIWPGQLAVIHARDVYFRGIVTVYRQFLARCGNSHRIHLTRMVVEVP
jgi:hypothetical protein